MSGQALRYLAVLGAGGALAHAALDIVRTDSVDGALICFVALMAIGPLLARLRPAAGLAVAAGVIAAGAAVLNLLKGDEVLLLAIGYLGASLLLLVSAGLLLRAERREAAARPGEV